MHMAAFSLGSAPWLRPWAQQGLEYLVANEALPAPWSLSLAATQQAQHSQQQQPPARKPYGQRQATATAAGRTQAAAPLRQGRGQGASPLHNTAQQEYHDRQSAAAGNDGEAPLRPPRAAAAPALDTTLWPQAWQEFFSRAKAGRVLWTYQFLGDDMGGKADPQRRALLNRLLKDMNLPAGTSTFWPCCLPQHCGGAADPNIFWQGARALKARIVIVMGYKALRALGLPEGTSLWSQVRHEGCLVYVTPDVPLLLDQPQRYGPTLQFLRENIGRALR